MSESDFFNDEARSDEDLIADGVLEDELPAVDVEAVDENVEIFGSAELGDVLDGGPVDPNEGNPARREFYERQ